MRLVGAAMRTPPGDLAATIAAIGEVPRDARVETVMSSSFGFGGQSSVVVLGRPT